MLSILDCQIIAKPNSSLSSEGMLKLFSVMTVVALIVAMGFVKMGAWLVLPFAGLELLAFALAFYHIKQHEADYESITITADDVVVEKRVKKAATKTVFQRYWTRVTLQSLGKHKSVLFIGSHGKGVEFGKTFINQEQQLVLLNELKQKLKYIN